MGLSAAQIAALRVYGENLGLAFQVFDDILDFTATEEELGKPVAATCGRGRSHRPSSSLATWRMALPRGLRVGGCDPQVRLVQESGAIPLSLAEAESLVARARTALEVFPSGVERDALDALAAYVTQRDR